MKRLPQIALLPDGKRLHLQDGPIDLIVEAKGSEREVRMAYEAAAQRFCEMVSANWFGQEPPTAEAMTRWLLHLYPIRQQEDWERLRVGVAGAGLPTAGTAHGDWYHETF